MRLKYPKGEETVNIRVVGEADELDNLNCLMNRIPFQIVTDLNQSIKIDFSIPCDKDAI